MDGVMNPIDAVIAQIGMPNGLVARKCQDHGAFLVPKGSRFKCPHCSGLHGTPDGTGGNGDTAEITQAKSAAITNMKHYIHLGL
jgi:hypothetical protein